MLAGGGRPWRPPWPPSTFTTSSLPIRPTPASATSARRSAARRCTGARYGTRVRACRWRPAAPSGRRSCLCSPATGCGCRAASRRDALAGYVFLSSVVGLAAVFYFAYASFFVLQKTCLLCVAVYVAVVGIFFVSSAAAPVGPGGAARASGSDLSGLLASPPALGLAALWLVGSLALVGLFPREPIGDAAPAHAAPRRRRRDAGSRGADRVAQVARRAAEAGRGAARRRREGAGA